MKMKTREKLVLLKRWKVIVDLAVFKSFIFPIADAKPIKINVKYILADDSRKSEFTETPL